MPQNLFSKNSKITFSNVRIEYRVHVLISIKRFRRGKSLLSSRWVIIPAVKYILAKYQKRNKPLIKYFYIRLGTKYRFLPSVGPWRKFPKSKVPVKFSVQLSMHFFETLLKGLAPLARDESSFRLSSSDFSQKTTGNQSLGTTGRSNTLESNRAMYTSIGETDTTRHGDNFARR